MEPYDLVALLADERRRQVAAALVLGASTLDEVKAATGLSSRAAGTALNRLVDGELVVRGDDGTYLLLGEAFRLATMRAAPPPEAGAVDDDDKVLRSCFRDGRLVRIPVKRAQRLLVLDRLAQEFEPGTRYSERQVNAALRRFHDDVAALRRYLVDEGMLDRAKGEYWRSGGTVR
jgi:hypothetical protein